MCLNFKTPEATNSVFSPVRIGSAEGRHCGWGTSLWGMEWGLGCREGALHSTEWGALCMGYPLKYILQNRGEKGRRVRHTFRQFVVIKSSAAVYFTATFTSSVISPSFH